MLEEAGRVWVRGALTEAELSALDAVCAVERAPGVRLAWSEDVARALTPVTRIVGQYLSGGKPVRVVAFDKSEEMNWGLPWHQDRVVALRECVEAPGFSNWTCKAGVWHAEPPTEVMESMLFARVHLDAATEDSGCLELALGSHARGKVVERDVAAVVAAAAHEMCVAERGDVLVAKALIMHRSQPSRTDAARRAVRVDYSGISLPPPARWAITGDLTSR